jgi:hypothetical protein
VTVNVAGMSHISALDGQRDKPLTRGSRLYFNLKNIIVGKTLPIFMFLYEKLSHKDKKYAYPICDIATPIFFNIRSAAEKV